MTDKHDSAAAPPESIKGEELYEEPPQTTVKDTIGIGIAIVLLCVIGWAGYLWLTPDRNVSDIWSFASAGNDSMEVSRQPAESMSAASNMEIRCDQCGMFASRSMSQIAVVWDNGEQGLFDSWDCVFNYASENAAGISSAEVIAYSSSLDDPEWLQAKSAVYLYGTSPVEGSMPPYVASFADADTAHSYHGDLGGELLDYSALQDKWQMDMPQAESMSEHSVHDEHPVAGDMDTAMPETAVPVQASSVSAGADDQPHLHDHEMNCTYCGMFADRSMSQVVGYWHDGTETHHDCWDCLFNYGTEEGLELTRALVKLYGSSLEEPEWTDAGQAAYLFGTSPIKGSMPPFIAAFAFKVEAQDASAELGGDLMSFEDLLSEWE